MVTLPGRKTLFAIIVLVILFLANIAVSVFLVLTLNTASLPTIDMRVTNITMGADEALLTYNLTIDNNNGFDLTLKQLQMSITNATTHFATIPLQGGTIPAHQSLSILDSPRLHFNATPTGALTVTLSCDIDIGIAMIHKTLPMTLSVTTNIDDILDQIKIPSLLIEPSFGTVTNTTIGLNANITVTNPNAFDLTLSDLGIAITTNTGDHVGTLTSPGGVIPAAGSATYRSTGDIAFVFLNADRLILTITANAGGTIAGITKTIPINTSVAITIPNLDIFLPHDHPLELHLGIDLHHYKNGLQGNINLSVSNPTGIPLYLKDLRIDYFSAYPHQMNFLSSSNLSPHELTPHGYFVFNGTIFFSWRELLLPSQPPLLPPPRLFAVLNANATLTGVTAHAIWIKFGYFMDLRPFKVVPT